MWVCAVADSKDASFNSKKQSEMFRNNIEIYQLVF